MISVIDHLDFRRARQRMPRTTEGGTQTGREDIII